MHIIYAYLCISMHICSGSEAIMKSFCGWASFLGGLKNGLRAQTSCDVKNVTLQLLIIFRLTWKIPLFFLEKVSVFFRPVSGVSEKSGTFKFYSLCFSGQNEDCWIGDSQHESYELSLCKPLDQHFRRPFPPTYDEAVSTAAGGRTATFDNIPDLVPPYTAYPSCADSVLPHQVASLGCRVLPANIDCVSNNGGSTLPAVLRRVYRPPPPPTTTLESSHCHRQFNPLFRHSFHLQFNQQGN